MTFKNLLLTLILGMTLFASCKNKTAYSITGTVDNTPDGTIVYLQMRNKPDWISMDSAVVKDGKFVIEGQIDPGILAFITINDERTMIIAEPGDITIDLSNGRPHGTATNEKLSVYLDQADPMDEEMMQLSEVISDFQDLKTNDSILYQRATERMTELESLSMQLLVNTIKDNIQNPLGVGFLCMYSSILADEIELLTDLAAQIPEQYKQLESVKTLLANIEKISLTSVGKQFSDLHFTTVDGKETSLKQLVDSSRYVLVDFWASWCAPCRQSLPGIRNLYDRFSSRGLTIVGISLDEDEQAWHNALSKYRMDWVQTSDLNGWKCEAAAIYGVRAIPATVLIDSTGTIVARNIESAELDEKLEAEL